MRLLTEIDRIKSVMGILAEEEMELDGPRMNKNLKSVVETLQFLKLYGNKIEKMLMDISEFSNV